MNAFLITNLVFPPISISSLCMGQVLSNLIPTPRYLSSLRMGQVPPNLTTTPLISPLYALVKFPLIWLPLPSLISF
jgi:hypothetical protein